MQSNLNKAQIDSISRFLADLAKIIFTATVVGFFVSGASGKVTPTILAIGSIAASIFFIYSVIILRHTQ